MATKVSVEDLLRSPALQLRLLAGQAGLSRSVSWAHVSELDDPTPWLLGAEVIMTTGIGVPHSAARQRAYLERLDDAGVSALALSAQLHVPRCAGPSSRRPRSAACRCWRCRWPCRSSRSHRRWRRPSRRTRGSGSARSCRCSGRCAGWRPRTSTTPRCSGGWSG
ncbi:PucR family transcriptional regulator ligand-binding domain-containing protein [Nonomuraea recticatena]|uniref:PucR family transcriptional regulator ligand-binding domain-containing protein n=1 Tax=Nonomuraea recticatena TaxID=46178 RepID=UPI00360BFD24